MRIASTALVLALLGAGCGGTATTPSTTTTTPVTSTQFFSGTLDVQGATFASFTVIQAGTVSVTLASVTTGATVGTSSPPVPTVLGVGLGVASADGLSCTVSSSVNTAAGFTAQLAVAAAVGTSCVQILDVGNLTGPVNFVVRIVHT